MNSFFSKDCFTLKRSQSIRSRGNKQPSCSSKPRNRPSKCAVKPGRQALHAIPELSEEDFASSPSLSRCSSSSNTCNALYPSTRLPTSSTCPRQKDRTSSDTSIVDFDLEQKGEARLSAYEFSIDDTLLMAPRPAPSPPSRSPPSSFPSTPSPSPSRTSFILPYVPSSPATLKPTSRKTPAYLALANTDTPDSFRLTFSDMSLTLSFPHPPHPPLPPITPCRARSLSPSPSFSTPSGSGSSTHSSPSTHSSDLPHTPTSSDEDDDDFYLQPSSPVFRPKRASIKPLFIAKRVSANVAVAGEDAEAEVEMGGAVACEGVEKEKEADWIREEEEDSDTDPEDYDALNDWYSQQFSDILTLYSSPSPVSPSFPIHSPQSRRRSQAYTAPARPDSIISVCPSSPTLSSPQCNAQDRRRRRQSEVYTAPARPDSIISVYPSSLAPLSPTTSGGHEGKRQSKPLPCIPIPSPIPPVLLMPTSNDLPRRKRTVIPPKPQRLPPPPPPSCAPSYSSSACARRSRAPPRMSIPADMDRLLGGEDELFGSESGSSTASVYSQDEKSSASAFFNLDLDLKLDLQLDTETPLRLPLSLPTSPVDLEYEFVSGLEQLAVFEELSTREREDEKESEKDRRSEEPALPETPAAKMYDPRSCHDSEHQLQFQQLRQQQEKTLRSRWSSSTLSSLHRDREHPPSASSRLKFYFGSRKGRGRGSRGLGSGPGSPLFPTSPVSYLAFSPLPSPSPASPRKRASGPGPGLRRSASSTSGTSDSSCESVASGGGLRRKPIPVEMFIKC